MWKQKPLQFQNQILKKLIKEKKKKKKKKQLTAMIINKN